LPKVNTLKKHFIYLFIVGFSVGYSQSFRKYSNEFMNIGVDAASLGMSGAVTASISDVTAGYWNPAGLIAVEDSQIALMHASYFANIAQYDYIGYAKNIDRNSSFGMTAIRFGVDDIMNTTQLIDNDGNIDYNRIRLFSAADYGVIFSYAQKLPLQGFTYGVNAKVIRRIIGDFADSWGFGFDVGFQFEKNNWRYGLMFRDITTTYNIWNINEKEYQTIGDAVSGENQELPETTEITAPKLQIGIARKFIIRYDYSILAGLNLNMRFTETNDLIATEFVSIEPALGMEAGYIDLIFVRFGMGNFQNTKQLSGTEKLTFQPNIGVGFKYKGIQIDYALTDIGNQSVALYSNIFSLKVNLDIFRK